MTRGGATLEELRDVYERRLTALRRFAEAVVADEEQARDVVQDAFARAVQLRGSFSGQGSLEAWVWKIVLNSARDELARGRRLAAQDAALGAPSEAPADESRAEEVERVRVAVAALPERQRLVLFLRYFADLEYGAIGEVLEISPGTVGATLNAAHSRMRQLLEEVA